jgi:Tfp pilus assembly protein PilV
MPPPTPSPSMSSASPPSTDPRRRRVRGVSLLEALAATAFLGVALLAFAANSVSLTRSAKTADSTSAAHALAQQELERLRSMPLGAAQLVPGPYADADNPLTAVGDTDGIFTRTWTVSANDVPSWGLKTVTVTVQWTDPTATHTTRVAAYVRCANIPC